MFFRKIIHKTLSARKVLFFVLLLGHHLCASAQMSQLVGIWTGVLHFSSDSLTLVLVVENKEDSIVAVLDSPDQYVTDIAIDKISFRNDTLRFSVKSIDCQFTGKKEGDSICGKFKQNGYRKKLTLRSTTMRKKFLRPQEPKEPFPYLSKELEFSYDKQLPPITGTLTVPENRKIKAIIVLISGSGHQDRDETIYLHKPFKVIADYLTRADYAVFRYDDAPIHTFAKLTTFDFVKQVNVICDTLRKQNELINCPIGLIGHSEGGLVAMMAAADNKNIDFIISLASISLPIQDILLYQNDIVAKFNNYSEAQRESNYMLNKSLYTILEKSKNITVAKEKITSFFNNYTSKMSDAQRKEYHLTPQDIMLISQQVFSPWMFTIFHIQPEKYIKKVQCPVLALNGDKDTQVQASTNLEAMKNFLKKNHRCQFVMVEGVNHLFQECTTGYFDEYGNIEETISPKVLKIMLDWLEKMY